jgi:solute carrier family 25 carnitine/acylcarnitine transporter 20/29
MDHLEFEADEIRTSQQLTKKAVLIDLMAGTVAGITSTWTGNPLDIIKFRMQVSPEISFRQTAHQIMREGGVRGFFRGVWSPALGNIPINALVFSANGICGKYLEMNKDRTKLSENQKIYLSGAFAGFVSLIAFVPSELIKIRIQDCHAMTQKNIY